MTDQIFLDVNLELEKLVERYGIEGGKFLEVRNNFLNSLKQRISHDFKEHSRMSDNNLESVTYNLRGNNLKLKLTTVYDNVYDKNQDNCNYLIEFLGGNKDSLDFFSNQIGQELGYSTWLYSKESKKAS